MSDVKIFTGNANRPLALAICESMKIKLGEALVTSFSDGETRVQIGEHVRGVDTYVVQSTCAPANQNIMELLVMVDALRRASAGSITAVIPYFGYARQDRKAAPRTPITASMVADLLAAVQVDRVVSVDLHAAQIQGFFKMPCDNLFAKPALLGDPLRAYYDKVVVSPDAGGVERARAFAKHLGASLAIIDKRREKANESEVMNVIGDVAGKDCLVVDDIIDTAGTLVHAADALIAHGARSVGACATHGVFSGPAGARIRDSALTEVIVTDTIPQPLADVPGSKVKAVSIAPLLASAIWRIHYNGSVSSLFV